MCSSATATGSRRCRSRTAGQRSATRCSRTSARGSSIPRAPSRLGLTPGPEFGRLQRGETIRGVRPEQVLGPPRPGRKMVISGDTAPCEALRVAAHGADVLVHEATFAEEERDAGRRDRPLDGGPGGALAREAEVSMLALTHFSTRYPVCAAARRGARDHSLAPCCPATSTRSRSRSPSAESQSSCAGRPDAARTATPPMRPPIRRRLLTAST